ncbi:hypothetical protein NLG97_g5430 [Lecanicillium saksenae]|uniref:Uncharacterized protein n=1 Tax=Lecanicillium saksenae TaxID=468837 RepID=A0ACC1QSH0_9HYPO|nr:hypothetical protein NLG97_g5430 [Lecanicillium saksenae]
MHTEMLQDMDKQAWTRYETCSAISGEAGISAADPATTLRTGPRPDGVMQRASLWLARKVFPPPDHDVENGDRPPFVRQGTTTTMLSRTIITTDENNLVPPGDKLLVFRSLTGIDTVPTVYVHGHAVRAAANMGVYPRVVRAEQKAAHRFRVYNILVNICLGSQMVIGAALTALGASGSSRKSVTAFGALNTMTAGFLTYLKGSDMPQKLKSVHESFKAVREYAEQREREFCLADCMLDPVAEAGIVTEMYQNVKREMDGNKSSALQKPCTCDSKEKEKMNSALQRLEQKLSHLPEGGPAVEPGLEKE